jgi:hypothetical protein
MQLNLQIFVRLDIIIDLISLFGFEIFNGITNLFVAPFEVIFIELISSFIVVWILFAFSIPFHKRDKVI